MNKVALNRLAEGLNKTSAGPTEVPIPDPMKNIALGPYAGALAGQILPKILPRGWMAAQRTRQNRPAPSLVDRFANVKFPWDRAGQGGSTNYRTNAGYVYGNTAGNALADGLSTGVSALRKTIR